MKSFPRCGVVAEAPYYLRNWNIKSLEVFSWTASTAIASASCASPTHSCSPSTSIPPNISSANSACISQHTDILNQAHHDFPSHYRQPAPPSTSPLTHSFPSRFSNAFTLPVSTKHALPSIVHSSVPLLPINQSDLSPAAPAPSYHPTAASYTAMSWMAKPSSCQAAREGYREKRSRAGQHNIWPHESASSLSWKAAGSLSSSNWAQQTFTRSLSHHIAADNPQTFSGSAVSLDQQPVVGCSGVDGMSALDMFDPVAGEAAANAGVIWGSSMEELAWEIFGPTQLGIQVWEAFHLGLGCPWWISIPIATVSIRLLLLPLSLKAKAASANFALAQQAWTESRQVSMLSATLLTRMQRWQLYRRSYHYLRKKYGTPRTAWYIVNSLVQIPLFITLSLALRRMSSFSWPGLTNEGIFYFPDLTSPALDLQSWAAPYGPAAVFLPLALLSLQMYSLDYIAAARSAPVRSALEISTLTYFLASLSVPHATLLYWLANSSFFVGQQHLLSKPLVARKLGMPMLLVNTRNEADGKLRQELEREEERDRLEAAVDVEFLVPLGKDSLASGNAETALACFDKALEQEPHDWDALLGRSRALFATQRLEEGQAALQTYISLTPDTETWTGAVLSTAAALVAEAKSDLVHLEQDSAEHKEEDQAACNTSARRSHKLEVAIELLKQVSTHKPESTEVWMSLGAAHSLLGRTQACLAALASAYATILTATQDLEQDKATGQMALKAKLEDLLRRTATELHKAGQPLPPLSEEVMQLLSSDEVEQQQSSNQ